MTKKSLPRVNAFFGFFVKFAAVIFRAASFERGVTIIKCRDKKEEGVRNWKMFFLLGYISAVFWELA